jgi:glycosyltransferase involved in cell wall biosynthesis
MSTISVIIPAFNRAALIAETLRSLLDQTFPATEIIVVDDGSTDGTAEVAARFGLPVKVIRRSNGGPAAARNTGFKISNGEFIHFFDSDDLAAPNKHEVQLKALEATGADIAYGPWVKGRFDGAQFSPSNQVYQQNGLPRKKRLVEALLTSWSVVPHAALFRRSIVVRAGGFPEDLFGTEDQQMFLSCLLAGAQVVHTPGTIEFYREGDTGKITESITGEVRRIREWGNFLVKARAACLKKNMDPARWFGFRQRAWEAHDDLRRIGEADQSLQKELRQIFSDQTPTCCYHWHRRWKRWRGGLQARLTGRRAASVFKMGPLKSFQIEQLERLGYRLVRSNTH